MINLFKTAFSGVTHSDHKAFDIITGEGGIIFSSAKNAFLDIKGITLKDSQIITAKELVDGKIVQMDTGEGKTYAIATAAMVKSVISNQPVFVIHPTSLLANIAFSDVNDIFNELNIKSTLFEYEKDYSNFNEIFANNKIIYTTHNAIASALLSEDLANDVSQIINFNKNASLILDEIDAILIEDGIVPFSLSKPSPINIDILKQAFSITEDFVKDSEYIYNGEVSITDFGFEKLHEKLEIENILTLEHSELYEAIINALEAVEYKKNGEYTVIDKKIVVVDQESGRIKEGFSLKNGVRQAAELLNKLDLSRGTKTVSKISYIDLVKEFTSFSGCSGSVDNFLSEFDLFFKKSITKIKRDNQDNTIKLDDILFGSSEDRAAFTVSKISEILKKNRSVIIGAATPDAALEIHRLLENSGLKVNDLIGLNDKSGYDIVQTAGEVGTVTIISATTARGVDIKPSKALIENGGFFFIGLGRNFMPHLDSQMQSRVGRQSAPATVQFLLTPEDPLLEKDVNKKIREKINSFNLANGEYAESKIVSKLISSAQNSAKEAIQEQLSKSIGEFEMLNSIRKAIKDIKIDHWERLATDDVFIAYIQELKDRYIAFYESRSLDVGQSIAEDFNESIQLNNEDELKKELSAVISAWINAAGVTELRNVVKHIISIELENRISFVIDEMNSLSAGKWLQSLHSNKNSDLEFKKNAIVIFENTYKPLSKDLFIIVLKTLKDAIGKD